jgi:hypothetical protein
MARLQPGILWENRPQQFFGIFQTHEPGLCRNERHNILSTELAITGMSLRSLAFNHNGKSGDRGLVNGGGLWVVLRKSGAVVLLGG